MNMDKNSGNHAPQTSVLFFIVATVAVILTLYASALPAAPTPAPTFTDEQLTAINAIPFGKCKPTIRQIVAHAKKAMVWITVLDENHQPATSGTGFFIDNGYGVLTNYHVVENGKYFKATIISSGETLSDGYLDDSNRACDLAVLRFRALYQYVSRQHERSPS